MPGKVKAARQEKRQEAAINAFKEQKRANEPDVEDLQDKLAQANTMARNVIIEKEGILLGIGMGLDAKSVPYVLKIPRIPALAQGGYVKANTPQLAMIGDNRHQGEVVAPEGKLQERADAAAGRAAQGHTDREGQHQSGNHQEQYAVGTGERNAHACQAGSTQRTVRKD